MAIKLPDGAPKHWPSNGFPPLKSARMPKATPDTDIAEDLRKQIGLNIADPTSESLTAEKAALIAQLLDTDFGTPAEPRVRIPDWNELAVAALVRPDPEKGVFRNLAAVASALKKWKPGVVKILRADSDAANAAKAELQLDDASLARGSVHYRRWCMNCHGPTGAGDGAHAIELAAMPRDYRQGIFKFITAYPDPKLPKKGLGAKGKPRRDDLKRTVRNGLDGSMMPAFPALADSELDDLISYVIHLSVRGETEFATLSKTVLPGEEDPEFAGPELEWLFNQNLLFVLSNWGTAARSAIKVPPENTTTDADRLESAFRGFKWYNSGEFGCAACHANYGREPALKWDFWGTVVQPRNLVQGVFRGGRRGEDLYARIYGGIHPSGMPDFREKLTTGPTYFDKPDKIWNLVHFLQALSDPYDRQRIQNPSTLAKLKDRLKADNDLFLDDQNNVKIDP